MARTAADPRRAGDPPRTDATLPGGEPVAGRPAVVQRGLWDRITGAVGAVAGGVRDRVLSTVGGLARSMPGYGVLCVVLGRDVITQRPVVRDATALVGALVGIVPGGAALWDNLQRSGAVTRAATWLSAELPRLDLTWDAVRALFSRAWDAVGASDLLDPTGLWQRLSGILRGPVDRLLTFARGAAGKLMEFVFEGVLTMTGGAGGQVMAIIRRAGDVLGTIVRDPVAFAGHLVAAVRGGLGQFARNIATHLRSGMVGWLTGALRGAVLLPQRFDLAGVLSFVANLLGLTWDWLRGRMVRLLGERTVRFVEGAVDWVRSLVTGGIGAVVGRLGDLVSGVVETVLGSIRDWVAGTVVGAALARLVSMFNPAGAVIQAVIAVYNTVQFFIERAQQLGALAESVFGAIGAIAAGRVEGAANAVEQALARAVPVVLGFMSRLIGLGDVATPVRTVLGRVRGVIDRVADRIVGWVAGIARRLVGRRAGRGQADTEPGGSDLTGAVRDATALLRARGATPESVRGGLESLRQRHRLRAAELVSGDGGALRIHVQRADAYTPAVLPSDPRIPRRHADGVGAVERHGEQGSRNRTGARIHWLESEHVLPFRIGAMLWEELGLPAIRRGGDEDHEQTTIMLYKGAAERKTYASRAGLFRSNADMRLINKLKGIMSRRAPSGSGERAPDPSGRPLRARLRGIPADPSAMTPEQIVDGARITQTLTIVRDHAVRRTTQAIAEDAADRTEGIALTHAERRGDAAGTAGPPTASQVRAAADAQLEDVKLMAVQALRTFLGARRSGGG